MSDSSEPTPERLDLDLILWSHVIRDGMEQDREAQYRNDSRRAA